MSIQIVKLDYPGTPPSYNHYAHKHWRTVSRIKKEWQSIWEILLFESGLSRVTGKGVEGRSVYCEALLRFPNRRRRDEGNYRAPIEKTLADALVNGGWLVDDTPEYFRMGFVHFSAHPGPSQIIVVMRVEDKGADTVAREAPRASESVE